MNTDQCSITDWYPGYADGGRTSPVSPISIHLPSTEAGAEDSSRDPIARTAYSPSPIRPAASDPPTPTLESAMSFSQSYKASLAEHPNKRAQIALDNAIGTVSPSTALARKPGTPMPRIPLPHEEFPVRIPPAGKESQLQHPLPRRLASHPLLLDQGVRNAENLAPSNAQDIPDTPPPKSPLRAKAEARTIGQALLPSPSFQQSTARIAPAIPSTAQIVARRKAVVPTVTTECTGPLTRTVEHTYTPVKHNLYPMSRKEREERTRARKLRDRPHVSRTIDAVVSVPASTARQRLKRARPPIPLPNLVPAPLSTRAGSAASSDLSWSNIATAAQTDLCTIATPRPSFDQLARRGVDASTTSSLSPAKTDSSDTAGRGSNTSSVALIAAEVAINKASSAPRTARIVVSKERPYTPRPRSASMPRLGGKRLSRTSYSEHMRVVTPELPSIDGGGQTPPLPSPPPNRALPPTPPASGSEGLRRKQVKTFSPMRRASQREVASSNASKSWNDQAATSNSGRSACDPRHEEHHAQFSGVQLQIQARLELLEKQNRALEEQNRALEKQNRALEADVRSMLMTNSGHDTSSIAHAAPENSEISMVWQDRASRRSKASHAASSSNGTGSDVCMSTQNPINAG